MKKNLVFLLVVVLFGFQAFGRKGQPILPYGNYTVEEVRAFALSDSEKAQKFREALVPLVQRKLNESGENLILSQSHVSWIFDQVVEQEAWLEARQFKNSRWMPEERVIDFYVSETRYEGSAGIFTYGKCSFPLYKVSCANLLEAQLNRVPGVPPVKVERHTVLKIDTIYDTFYKSDTIYQPVWVEEPERFVESRVEVVIVHQPQPYYEPVFQPVFAPVFMPYIAPQWGGGYNNVCVNNSNYYYSSNTVINNTNTTNTRIVNPPRREEGGPAGVPGHDAGGPAGVPGFPAGAPGGAGGHPANAPGYESDGGPGGVGGFSARNQSQNVDFSKSAQTSSSSNTRRSSTASSQRSDRFSSSTTNQASSRNWRGDQATSTGNTTNRSINSSSNRRVANSVGERQGVNTTNKSASISGYSNQRGDARTSSYSPQTRTSNVEGSRTNSFRSSPTIRSGGYSGGSAPRSSFSGGSSGMRSSGVSGGMPRSSFSGGSSGMRSSGMGMSGGGGMSRSSSGRR